MCGIAGIYRRGAPANDEPAIRAMMAELEHRGPDDHGFARVEGLSLGHRRLAILDLSEAGRQPMVTPDERWIIADSDFYGRSVAGVYRAYFRTFTKGVTTGKVWKPAGHRANAYEQALLNYADLTPGAFKPLRAPGSRRIGILNLDDLAIVKVPQGLEFTFTLPSGAYATTVLREFTRKAFRPPT